MKIPRISFVLVLIIVVLALVYLASHILTAPDGVLSRFHNQDTDQVIDQEFGRTLADYESFEMRIGDEVYTLALADTPTLRMRGLSEVTTLDPFDGMIFVFDREGEYSFWMKDMLFPIDIVWLNKDMEIVLIHEHIQPETFPESFGGEVVSQYVIEFPAGFVESVGLEIGDIRNG